MRVHFDEMDWLAANKTRLELDYAGEYIAVSGRSMVAHGPSPSAVHEEAVRRGHPNALIHRVLPRRFQGMKFVR